MYLVTSFDFGGNSNVNVHVLTDDLTSADTVYASVLEVCDAQNAKQNNLAGKMLVELREIPLNTPMIGSDALTLFWGNDAALNSNNFD
jgi:hypothetical protein